MCIIIIRITGKFAMQNDENGSLFIQRTHNESNLIDRNNFVFTTFEFTNATEYRRIFSRQDQCFGRIWNLFGEEPKHYQLRRNSENRVLIFYREKYTFR